MSTPQTKSVLGKGLASLLPPMSNLPPLGGDQPHEPVMATQNPGSRAATEGLAPNRDRHPGIAVLDVNEIKANEFQPRREFDQQALEELAQSIRENGLIQPLVVRKTNEGYELIAGERRLRASKIAGLKMVPVVIRKSTDRESLELAIVENIQREDLNCVDEGLAYFQLMQEFQLSQEDLAKRMGKDRATIANALRILKLSDFILVELKKGSLTRGHAKALLSVEDASERERLARQVLEKSLSVRQTEKTAQDIKQQNGKKAQGGTTEKLASGPTDAASLKLAQDLTRRYMSKVEIRGGAGTGQIILHYSSKDELIRIFAQLMGE